MDKQKDTYRNINTVGLNNRHGPEGGVEEEGRGEDIQQ